MQTLANIFCVHRFVGCSILIASAMISDLLMEQLDFTDVETAAIAAVAVAAVSSWYCLDECIQEENDQTYVNQALGVRDQLAVLLQTPSLFKILTNFTAEEFEELCGAVCPLIESNARTTGAPRSVFGRRPKLSSQQRVLHLVFYLKHDNVVRFDAFNWNWSKSSACDDAIFVASCINSALKHELRWPDANERRILAETLQDFRGCIGFIDGVSKLSGVLEGSNVSGGGL
jgi:hypothetical protein